MELTLHKLSERFLITFGAGEFKNFCFKEGEIIGCILIQKEPEYSETFYKVIAQQDQIDFSALSEEEQKEIGWFDVQKLAQYYAKSRVDVSTAWGSYVDGFRKAQEIFSDRKFTLEDMRKCFFNGGYMKDENEWNHYIQSISQPKSWKIDGLWENNKFKITKIL